MFQILNFKLYIYFCLFFIFCLKTSLFIFTILDNFSLFLYFKSLFNINIDYTYECWQLMRPEYYYKWNDHCPHINICKAKDVGVSSSENLFDKSCFFCMTQSGYIYHWNTSDRLQFKRKTVNLTWFCPYTSSTLLSNLMGILPKYSMPFLNQ